MKIKYTKEWTPADEGQAALDAENSKKYSILWPSKGDKFTYEKVYK